MRSPATRRRSRRGSANGSTTSTAGRRTSRSSAASGWRRCGRARRRLARWTTGRTADGDRALPRHRRRPIRRVLRRSARLRDGRADGRGVRPRPARGPDVVAGRSAEFGGAPDARPPAADARGLEPLRHRGRGLDGAGRHHDRCRCHLPQPDGDRARRKADPCRRPRRQPDRAVRATPMSDPGTFTKSEMMIVAAARELAGQHVCFVGVGLPNIAVNLAQRTVAPDLELVYEAGVFGARPARLPLSIGDPTIVTGATAVVSMLELFGYYLQRGLIDVGFLGAAQVDRFGNINTTVIGDYEHPTTRLPGSGGACEIAINAREVFVIMRQSKRSFVDRIDFRTSPGNLGGAEQAEPIRREGGWLGRGPSVVVTDLGIYHFDDAGEMRLDSLHQGATVEAVRETIGWDVAIAHDLAATPAPTDGELHLIREELDPGGAYTR